MNAFAAKGIRHYESAAWRAALAS